MASAMPPLAEAGSAAQPEPAAAVVAMQDYPLGRGGMAMVPASEGGELATSPAGGPPPVGAPIGGHPPASEMPAVPDLSGHGLT